MNKEMRKYTAFLFPDTGEGGYTVVVPALLGCITEGRTVEEALAMAKEAIQLYLESSAAHGEDVLEEASSPVIATVEVEVPAKERVG